MCNILNIMYNNTSQGYFQSYLAILPFNLMCNIPNIMCNTTSQYHCQLIFFTQYIYLYSFFFWAYSLYIYYSIVFILMLLVYVSNLWHKNFLQDE